MKNEFDNKLTDKGWRSMRGLLDREMPEQRRRRRFAWWLFALLLLPAAGAGGWWIFGEPQPEKAAPPVEKPKIPEPVAAVQDLKTFKKLSNLPTSPSSDDSKSSGESPAWPRLLFSPGDANESRQNSVNSEVVAGEDTRHGSEKPVFRDTVLSENSWRSTKKEDLTIFKKLSNLAPLSVAPQFVENEIKNTPEPSAVEPSAISPIKKHVEPKRWSFGLAAGISSEKLSAVNGFSGGFAGDWKPLRRWGLRSGLHYAQYEYQKSSRPVVSLDGEQYVTATGNDAVKFDFQNTPGTSADVAAVTVWIPVERLRRLEMPLLAFWQPLRPLRVFAGFSCSYTLGAQTSQLNYANNKAYLAIGQEAISNLNDLAARKLPRFKTDGQAGVGLRLGKHLEIDAFYRFGWPKSGQSANLDSNGFSYGMTWTNSGKGSRNHFLLHSIWFF